MASHRRLTRADWVMAARKAMISSGIDDVKVDRLARKLKVTTGSFYWHFKRHRELLDALLNDWRENNQREIKAVGNHIEQGTEGLIELFRLWLGEDPSFPGFDIAVRAWARKSSKVAIVVYEIDEAWINLFMAIYERSGYSPLESLARARIMYFHQVGYYALFVRESLEDRKALAPYYYKALTGTQAPFELEEMLLHLKSPSKRLHDLEGENSPNDPLRS